MGMEEGGDRKVGKRMSGGLEFREMELGIEDWIENKGGKRKMGGK